ncbi:MAG: alpha/beta hydrolase [Anaerolineales bacterium]|nr:alpha/beta hydrolase [Anaerolineales bacterium]
MDNSSLRAPASGYFSSGMPYNRLGRGSHPLIVFQGLMFENKPQPGLDIFYRFLGQDYTVYSVLRRPGMPPGYSMKDMADDYATMIREEFGGPLDVIGVSTGGSIVQHFAADHPELVRRLVIHSSAYTLSEEAKRLQLEIGHLAQQRQWAQAYTVLFGSVLPHAGIVKYLLKPLLWLGARFMALNPPKDPSDLVVTIEAEDRHDFKTRLAEITAPTLVIAGMRDPFYTPALFRQTAEGIPNARLILYEGMGHPASGKQFARDVLAFLRQE